METIINEKSYSDFLIQYSSELKSAKLQLSEIASRSSDISDELYSKIERALSQYDKNVEEFIFNASLYISIDDIVEFALRNQNRFGTEPQFVLEAIERVYSILKREKFLNENNITENIKDFNLYIGNTYYDEFDEYQIYFADNYIELNDGEQALEQYDYPEEDETVKGSDYDLYYSSLGGYLEIIKDDKVLTTFYLDEMKKIEEKIDKLCEKCECTIVKGKCKCNSESIDETNTEEVEVLPEVKPKEKEKEKEKGKPHVNPFRPGKKSPEETPKPKALLNLLDTEDEEETEEKIDENSKNIYLEFDEVKPGMVGSDYNDELVKIIKKGTLESLKNDMIGSQASYSDYLEFYDSDDDNYVAVVLVDDFESFDHHIGDTIVYHYGDDGVLVKSKEKLDEVESLDEKISFKHPLLNSKSSNSNYVMNFEEFKKSKVKPVFGQNPSYTDAKTDKLKIEKSGESKDGLDKNQK